MARRGYYYSFSFYYANERKFESSQNLYLKVFVTHILGVKDDPIVADALGMSVDEAGYFKTAADTIESALFESNHIQTDAIFWI